MTDDLVERLCGDLSQVRAPRGTELNALSWQTEAPLRMLLNNLDAEVAEHPEKLVVYGGSGKAARSHDALRAIGPPVGQLFAVGISPGSLHGRRSNLCLHLFVAGPPARLPEHVPHDIF